MTFLIAAKRDKKMVKIKILALTLGIWLCILALTASQLMWSRHLVILNEASQAQDLARSLALQADTIVRAADIVLQGIAERVQTDGTNPAAIERIDKVLATRVNNDARFHAFGLFNAQGEAIASSRSTPHLKFNIYDRPYFAAALIATNEDTPVISDPILARSDNTWMIVISRAIYLKDGSFSGIAVASISIDMLQKLYDSINVGRYGAVQINNADSILMVRHPYGDASINGNQYASQIFESSQGPDIENPIDFTSAVGHSHQLGTAVKIPRYHLQVAVSFDKAEMLEGWQHQLEFEVALMLIMLACALIAFRVFAKQAKLREASEAQYRLLADHSSEVVVVINQEGQYEYVSPSFFTLTGWTPEQINGKDPIDYTFAADAPKLLAAIDAYERGEKPKPIKFRYVLPNGQLKWMEMMAKLTPGTSTDPKKLICSQRDITMRMQAEEALAAAIEQLSQMLLIDQLTGITNRRGFDQGIDTEWQRAARNEMSIAMMMIDVDWFKPYNDHYGHVEGDHCLRAVAQMLKSSMHRSGDMVTRYGGEEFAVILPHTTLNEAFDVAERLQTIIAETAIPHAKSEFQQLTLSIGVAAIVPPRISNPSLLIAMADNAVYQAKFRGRNQIALASVQADLSSYVAH